ncbi:hypothetical protein V492_06786 [Pseudogymnoascus sp. VKM F-4246]|nr:hypothetical protein V492_06786 [Pseudogymnoascus sp. VKM F-4246]
MQIAKGLHPGRQGATGDLLCLAAENGHASVLKYLLPARRCDWGPRMPEFGCHLDKLLVRPSRKGHHGAVKVLLDHGADHSWANVKGRTALHHAATSGFSSVIEVLLDGGAEISAPDWHQGADISAKCNAGRSPIFNAVESNNLELAEFLLSKGCDPMSRENLGSTPLHRAVENGLYEMSKLLVRYGSQVDAEADSKTTVLDWAIRGRDVRVVIFILEALAKMPPANALGSSALHPAAALGRPEAVKILIDKGYDVNLKILDRGYTPLHEAFSRRCIGSMEHLLNKGADVNAVMGNGTTLLQFAAAAEGDLVNAVQLLLKNGADMEAWDVDGRTPLDMAMTAGNYDVVELLKENRPIGLHAALRRRRSVSMDIFKGR